MTVAATQVPFSRPCLGFEEENAVTNVLRSGWIVGGPQLDAFERAFATRCGAQFAIATSSWTTAAFLVLKSWNIGVGDEVIVPSLTFIATVNAIKHTGATPVFADVDPRTFNVSTADVARRITRRTKVILPVDQLGLPCDLTALTNLAARHGLLVLDDAACAFGSSIDGQPIGAFGTATIFSLHARKVITTGEGGMILTNDRPFRDRLRQLRHQGMSMSDFDRHGNRPTRFETYDDIGYNFRMTDIQAAIGLAQLSRAESILDRRAALASRYSEKLEYSQLVIPPFVPAGVAPNWQSYQVTVRPNSRISRNKLLDMLFDRGVHARRGVMASHLEPAYAGCGYDLPVTEDIAARTLQLPLYPEMTQSEQDQVISALDDIAKLS
jgi:perosamine synthetase